MHCGLLITTLMLLAACGGGPANPVYPRAVKGYALSGEQVLTGERVPDYVKPTGVVRAVQLAYQGSNPVQVTVFETTGSSVAFEALQTWRAQDGKRAVHAGRYFLVGQAEKPDPAALDAFLTEFEKQLQ